MPIAVFGLGSNLGNRKSNILKAKILLKKYFGYGNFLCDASDLCSNAVVKEGSPDVFKRLSYVNSAIAFDLKISPLILLKKINKIEKRLGRRKKHDWSPRKIDIDILFYEGNNIDLPKLKIPHPELLKRDFALIPLKEIFAKLKLDLPKAFGN